MPPQNPQQGTSPFSVVPQYNTMQMNAGILPTGVPAMHPGQVSAMLQQQAMQLQYSTLQAPMLMGGQRLAQPGMFGPAMAPPLFGLDMQARQQATHGISRGLNLVSGAVGIGARAMGGLAASAIGGPIGGLAYEFLGGGQAVENLAQMPFQPLVADRQRMLALQASSTRFVAGGSSLSSAGVGLSAFGAQQVTSGLNRMSMDRGFQAATQGMFNRADLDRITRLSGELGMLDNTQTADQMVREVKKVSKALSNFMKLAEEPDIQRAMQQMARLRSAGFTTMEMPTAAANARTFARMAGVSVQEAMAGAEHGMGMFQAAGLTGAAGFNAGLAAQGYARQGAMFMTPQQLALAGGREGLESSLLQASRGALTNPALTASLLSFRGGSASVDPAAIQRMISGGFGNIGAQVQQSAANIRGAGLGGMNDMMARMPELQDTIARQLGPNGMMLLAGIQAQQIQRQMHGAVSFGNALAMANPGMDPTQAIHIERMMANPDFQRNIVRQMEVSQRENAVGRRNEVMERTSFRNRARRYMEDRFQLSNLAPVIGALPGSISSLASAGLQGLSAAGVDTSVHGLGEAFESNYVHPISQYLADEQDQEEALLQQGEGPSRVIRRARYGSDALTLATRVRMRRRGFDFAGMRAMQRRVDALSAGEDAGSVQLNQDAAAALRSGSLTSYALARGVRHFYGAQGFGHNEAAQGGAAMMDVYQGNLSFRERIAEEFTGGPTAQQMNTRLAQQAGFAAIMDAAENTGGAAGYRRTATTIGGQIARATGRTAQQGAARVGSATAVAANAIAAAVQGANGAHIGAGNEAVMRLQVNTALTRAGYSAQEISAMTSNTQFMGQAMNDAQRGMSQEQRDVLSRWTERSRSTRAVMQGRTLSNTIEEGNRAGARAENALGLHGRTESSTAVMGLLGSTGDAASDAKKQRIFAAHMMINSGRPEVAAKGRNELAAIRSTMSPDEFQTLNDAVEGTINSMAPEDLRRMGQRVSRAGNGDVRAVNRVVSGIAADVATKQTGAELTAIRSVLGDAADIYTRTGSVAALRQNPSLVKDRTIRAMLQDPSKSNEDIQAAIQRAALGQTDTARSTDSVGAGVTEGEAAAGDTTKALLETLNRGFEEFPSATRNLDSAANRLHDVADRLADAGGIERAARGANAADGDSSGLSIMDFSTIGVVRNVYNALIR